MTVRRASDGVTRTKAQVTAAFTAVTQETVYTADQDYVEDFDMEGVVGHETGRRLVFKGGLRYTQSELDRAFPTSTVDSITPNTGPQAGGTAVTIKGTNFSAGATVTIGVAATSVVVVDDKTITCVTGATTAGAKNVVVADEGVNVTLTNGFTYV